MYNRSGQNPDNREPTLLAQVLRCVTIPLHGAAETERRMLI
jgi:hypothetical protein